MEIAKLPEEVLLSLYGDGLTEDFHRIRISVFEENLKPIYGVIENPKVYSYVREEAVLSLCCFVLHEELERKVVVDYFKKIVFD